VVFGRLSCRASAFLIPRRCLGQRPICTISLPQHNPAEAETTAGALLKKHIVHIPAERYFISELCQIAVEEATLRNGIMTPNSIPLFHTRTLLLSAMVMFCPLQAVANEVVSFQETTQMGNEILVYGDFKREIEGRSAWVAGEFGPYLLISAFTGGMGCPGIHYMLDTSKTTPVLSESFGGCMETVDLVSFADGQVVFRGDIAKGPTEWVYSGGERVTEREAATLAAGIPIDASAELLSSTTLTSLFYAAEWQDELTTLVGTAAMKDMGFYLSGPSDAFTQDGSWLSSRGCGRSMCNMRFAAMAIHPTERNILLARVDVGDRGFEAWGTPIGALPKSITQVVVEAADDRAIRQAFEAKPSDTRKALQTRMASAGFYAGSVDGVFGERTRSALLSTAVAQAGKIGFIPDLTSSAGVDRVLNALLQTKPPTVANASASPPDQPIYVGEWDCQGLRLSLTADSYNFGMPAPIAILSAEPAPNDAATIGLTLVDGSLYGLFDITADTLVWSSPASGDIFDCSRIQ